MKNNDDLKEILLEKMKSNNVFSMDPELKEIWGNKEDDLWDKI